MAFSWRPPAFVLHTHAYLCLCSFACLQGEGANGQAAAPESTLQPEVTVQASGGWPASLPFDPCPPPPLPPASPALNPSLPSNSPFPSLRYLRT